MSRNQIRNEIKIAKDNISGVTINYKSLELEETIQKDIDKSRTGFGPINDTIWNALKKVD
jgi:hypothetical protein